MKKKSNSQIKVALPPPGKTAIHERRQGFAIKDPLRIVFVTAPEDEAETLAATLLQERLIACANLHKGVTSLYWWEGRIEKSSETLMLLKTPASKINLLMRRVRELHSYAIPEFLALQTLEANPDYLDWALKETTKESRT